MPLGFILNIAGKKMGLNPSDNTQREVLLRFANEAMTELYNISDMTGSLMEQLFKVNGDQTIAMPYYVGQIRAMREYDTFIPWHLNQMRPRYNVSNWQDQWRNWRLKGLGPLETSIRNQSVVVLTVDVVEDPPVVVTITGSNQVASLINEMVTMDSISKETTNDFLEITAIKKDRVNGYNVNVYDVDGPVDGIHLSTIHNHMLQAQYQIIDVSTAPFLNQNNGKLDHYIEVLYKKFLPWMKEDGDEFPALGYDNVVVNKILQLWSEEQGKTEQAIGYLAKSNLLLAQIHEDANRGTEDVVSLVPNQQDYLLSRERPNRPTRYGNPYVSGKYGYY